MSEASRILVIGDDMRIFLTIVRSFGRAGRSVEAFPYGSTPALNSRYISRVHAAPQFDLDRAAWNAALLKLLQTDTFDIVVPCSDPAIIFLDSVRHLLPNQRIAIPAAHTIATFYDKEQTHKCCEALGISMARSGGLAIEDTAASLEATYGLPLVLKPRRTFFADKGDAREVVEIADDRAELAEILLRIKDRSRYLVESFFVGDGVGVSVLACDGEILQAFQHRRLREGRGGASSYRISEMPQPGLLAACTSVMRETRHTGVCMFEFRHNQKTQDWILIEINARFWGSMALPLALGVDFPNQLHDLMVHGTRPSPRTYVSGVRSRNLLLDGYNLVKQIRHLDPAKFPSWMAAVGDYALQPFRWIARTEKSDTFVADDLRPAIGEFGLLFRKLKSFIGTGHTAALYSSASVDENHPRVHRPRP